ncbi:hypothetical protein FFLO_00152 [Filobasidium floriforme]|uniref:Double-strand break repair protein n=1 Tax=Filobasidium floriforme TaxID=5210 RepID=A0A8K0JSE4_9TREE|nr:hypothetical protein FFLO_00152 [Filobasidium floriforme]
MVSQHGRASRSQQSQQREQPVEEDAPAATPSIRDIGKSGCFRILIATDNHVGYNERDPIRGQDSMNTFREILEIAKERKVDFILLAGDLFHENRPSRACLHQMIALLREYSLGDRPVEMELLSDPMEGNTPGFNFPAINYEDPNLNVAIPVFSIHGNHDDPQGTGPEGALCALDILAAAGVINYFGKVHLAASEEDPNDPNSSGIKIRPVLLQKGGTRLAMYGVGNVKDTRMHYELRSNRVRMFMPQEDNQSNWFNLLLVHQNRVKHGPQNSVPEGMFDDSIDLVLWGHEHDCRIEPEKVPNKTYYISQPGSSVATSLAHGEAIPKKVGILSIQEGQFNIEPIPLKTVRPFKIGDIVLEEEADNEENGIDMQKRETITAFLKIKIDELITEAENEWKELHPGTKEKMMLPLIRLRVETTGAKELTNGPRIGSDFKERVANPKDVIQYHKKKAFVSKKDRVTADQPDLDEMDEDGLLSSSGTGEGPSKIRMGELVKKYLQAQTLEVLGEDDLEDAVTRYVDKDDTDAIKDFVKETLEGMTGGLKKNESNVDYDDMSTFKQLIQDQKEKQATQPRAERNKGGKQANRQRRAGSDDSMLEDDDFMGEESDDIPLPANRATKTAAAKKAPAKKAPAKAPAKRGAKKAAPLFNNSDDDDDDEEEEEAVESDEMDFQPRSTPAAAKKKTTAASASRAAAGTSTRGKRGAKAATGGARQSQLSFGASGSRPPRRAAAQVTGSIEISDDDEDD